MPDRFPNALKEYPEAMQIVIKKLVRRIDAGKNALIVVVGQTGCLSGETIINTNRNELGRPYSIKHLYNAYHNIHNYRCRGWDLSKPTFVRSFNGKIIRLNKLKNVSYSGKKQVYNLALENGLSIKVTKDHKFLTKDNGWMELNKLLGKEVMCGTLNAKCSNRKRIKLRDIGLNVGKNHPYNIQPNGQITVHVLIYEARMNNLGFTEYLDILLNEPEKCKQLKFINPSLQVIHHKDGCHYNNSIENLELMEKQEHYFEHNGYTNFSQGIPKFSKVLSIDYIGEEDTYDIECEEPNHNFVANGIVVHNSGKSLSTIQIMRGIYMYMHGKDPEDDYMIQHVFFQARPFMEAMKKISDRVVEGKNPITQAWLWDEAGVEASHKEFQSVRNKILGWLVQTFRNLRQIVFFTVPSMAFIDATIRKMLHYYFEVVGVDKNNKICIIKPLQLQYNIRLDKMYYHNLTLAGKNEFVQEVDMIGVHKITDELEAKYDVEKNKFTGDLNDQILASLNKIETKGGFRMMLTPRQQQIVEIMKRGVSDVTEISKEMGVPYPTIAQNIQYIGKKGVNLHDLAKEKPVLEL